jgi:hypothetical protein
VAFPVAGARDGRACCAKSFDAPVTTAAIAAILPKKLRRVLLAILFLLRIFTFESKFGRRLLPFRHGIERELP